MTPDDILNQLDPDKFQCMLTKKWITVGDHCDWFNIATDDDNYWNCIKHCPKFLHAPNNILGESRIIP